MIKSIKKDLPEEQIKNLQAIIDKFLRLGAVEQSVMVGFAEGMCFKEKKPAS